MYNIEYSSHEKNKLLRILDNEKHLADIDCFIDLAIKVQNELLKLQSRVEECNFKLSQQICSLENDIAKAQMSINEAEQSIRNTPTIETVYSNKDSLQKGETPITRPINSDIIAKNKDTKAYYQKELEGCSRRLQLLNKDKENLQNGANKISHYLSAVSNAINNLNCARKYAKSDCNEYKQIIKNAAIYMENYYNISATYSSLERVTHIEPKEGW